MYSVPFHTFCTIRSSFSSAATTNVPLLQPFLCKEPAHLSGNPLRVISCYESFLRYPFSIHTEAKNCLGLLYSITGNGLVATSKTTYYIPETSLFLFPCNNEHVIEASTSCWDIKLFYLTGDPLQDYYSFFLQYNNGSMIYPVSEYSCIPARLHKITPQKKEQTLISFLEETELLHGFFTNLLIELIQNCSTSAPIPEYLLTMKQLFDMNYKENYTLDSLSTLLKTSKYRLCREFTAYYGLSPLQYLNQCRIKEACRLLTETSLHVYQVGTLVGICNTNHFINLFKRTCGITPAVYRTTHHIVT